MFENSGKTKDDACFKEIIDEIENKIERNGTPQSPQELNNTLSENRNISFDYRCLHLHLEVDIYY
jgi:hypothetical protein